MMFVQSSLLEESFAVSKLVRLVILKPLESRCHLRLFRKILAKPHEYKLCLSSRLF